MLDITELEDLLDEIQRRVIEANRRGTLDSLLESLGMSDLAKPAAPIFESYKDGKIVVIGQSDVKEDVLKTTVGKLGIDKNRLECCLSYEEAKSFNYRKLQYAPQYRVVLFGPVPHKTEGTADRRSVIAEMEQNAGYPKVVRLTAGGQLKITKANFRQALEQLINEGYIE